MGYILLGVSCGWPMVSMEIVANFTGPVFTDRIGKMQTRPVVLQYETGFTPTQPPRYPVPYRYQERIAEHLQKLKAEGVIQDVDPSESATEARPRPSL